MRRPAGPWTPAVHELLAYLRAAGLDAVPSVRAVEQGREVLEYVPGDTADAHDPWPAWVWSDALLMQTAAWLRRFHNAVAAYRPRGPRQWRFGDVELGGGEIVCHHDVGPYNVVVGFDCDGVPQLRCVIDWDAAGPGKPIDDVAWMAWHFVPCFDTCPDDEVVRRLRLLADAYGIAARDVLDAVEPAQRSANAAILARAEAGDRGLAALVEGGHVAWNLAQLDTFFTRLPRLRAFLDETS